MQEKVSAQYKNEIEMAKAQRDYELKKAVYDMEVNTKKAESEMAYQLQVQQSHDAAQIKLLKPWQEWISDMVMRSTRASFWKRSLVDFAVLLLQVAKTKQRIEEEKMQVQVVERTQQIMLQEQEITRKEMELEAKVRKPAEAEKYKLEKLAEAERLAYTTAWWFFPEHLCVVTAQTWNQCRGA